MKNVVFEIKKITENENYKTEIIENYRKITEKLGTSNAASITAEKIYGFF